PLCAAGAPCDYCRCGVIDMPIEDRSLVSEHIFEIRQRALGRVLDIRGLIADRISERLALSYWSITDNRVDFQTSADSDREAAFVSHRNLGYVTRRAETRNFFVDRTLRFIRELLHLDGFELRSVLRFGVRTRVLYPYQGRFEALTRRVTELMPLHQNYTQPFNASVEDVGPVIVLRREDLRIKVQAGPMNLQQSKSLMKGHDDLPDVGFYFDLDQYKSDLGPMQEGDIAALLRSLHNQAWHAVDFYNRLLF
ncbi:MAG: hypothetical protein ACRD2L_04785, partial [Terriglobia bacterium]